VSANYSQNARYPFNFKEIESSGGLAKISHASLGTNNELYIYSTSGVQKLNTAKAVNSFPEVTDFLAGGSFESFDSVTCLFTQVNFTTPMLKRVAVVADRYLVFSYGLASGSILTHALVYDSALERWGKLKVDHIAPFEYQLLSSTLSDTPKKSIAFLKANGQIVYADFDIRFRQANDSVLILGKFQHHRAVEIALDEVDLENVRAFSIFNLTALASMDGKTTTPVNLIELVRGAKIRSFGADFWAENFSLVLSGTFDLNSFILYYHTDGEL
jgi:hypothetical protein